MTCAGKRFLGLMNHPEMLAPKWVNDSFQGYSILYLVRIITDDHSQWPVFEFVTRGNVLLICIYHPVI